MEKSVILKRLESIFIDVFDLDTFLLTESISADDIETWDSINHIQLVGEIQKTFNIKINAREMMSWDNVGDIIETIKEKVNG